MTRRTYAEATTVRFIRWFDAAKMEHGDPPMLRHILCWLSDREDYRDPLNALHGLCFGLSQRNEPFILQWIATQLIRQLEEEYEFSDTAERFFNAMVRRCGIDDSEVRMYDKHTRVGTLHDLGLAKHKEKCNEETVNG